MRPAARLATLLAVALPLLSLAAPPIEPRAFTQAYAERLRKAVPGAKVVVTGDLEVLWTPAGGQEHTAFLDNAWKQVQRAPADLDTILDRMVGAAVETNRPADRLVERSRVVPVIKDKAWLEESQRALRARGAKDVSRLAGVNEDYNGALTIFYVEDLEKGIAYLTPEALERSGLKRAELRALAVKNLQALLPPIELRGGDGLFMVTAGGDYEASLLLVDSLWTGDQLAGKVKGEVVVAVPARDLLLMTGSKDAEGLRRLRELARRGVSESSYSLTDQLFVRRGDRFVLLDPP